MSTKPTHEQAQLHLQLYDLRREAKLRQARDWYFRNYFVKTLEDSARIAPPGSENGALAMQVLSYWENACALLNYGLLHEDLFFETSGEFFAVWERVKPVIPEYRKLFSSSTLFGHLEQAAQRFETWTEARNPGQIAAMRQMWAQMQQQSQAQTAATAKA